MELLLLHGYEFFGVFILIKTIGRWRDAGGDDVLVYPIMSIAFRVTTIVRQSVNLHTSAGRAGFKYVHGRYPVVAVVLGHEENTNLFSARFSRTRGRRVATTMSEDRGRRLRDTEPGPSRSAFARELCECAVRFSGVIF